MVPPLPKPQALAAYLFYGSMALFIGADVLQGNLPLFKRTIAAFAQGNALLGGLHLLYDLVFVGLVVGTGLLIRGGKSWASFLFLPLALWGSYVAARRLFALPAFQPVTLLTGLAIVLLLGAAAACLRGLVLRRQKAA
ncbi:hypothetical protein LJ737_01530 [Hymenobacter sp. 15J16-1T3B]|uniref:hypothetical protein n=1 Tax=Hymenobacter sp. 15J16-1T3B TaxID=2886941 RepID=UPI001D0FF988|nr:hypothetical protein [Hymenobacter sp. 15J16-1T3B]MCC3155899.1 hypothetical protein [Hymenobacter sp. 15J16-1T3B]